MKSLIELLNKLQTTINNIQDKIAKDNALLWYNSIPQDVSLWNVCFKMKQTNCSLTANATNEEIEDWCVKNIADVENQKFCGEIVFKEKDEKGNHHFDILNQETKEIVFSKDVTADNIERKLSYAYEKFEDLDVIQYSIKFVGNYFYEFVFSGREKRITDNKLFEKTFVLTNGNFNEERTLKTIIEEITIEDDLSTENLSTKEIIKTTSILDNGLVDKIDIKKTLRVPGKSDKVVLESIIVDENRDFVKTKNKQYVTLIEDELTEIEDNQTEMDSEQTFIKEELAATEEGTIETENSQSNPQDELTEIEDKNLIDDIE